MKKLTDEKPDTLKLSQVSRRAIDTSIEIELAPPELIAYQHTVLCQTCLPYRNPGDDVRKWERRQGEVYLRVDAGSALNPKINEYVDLALPYGTKPRLILAHLNSQALKTGSPRIDMDRSLTAFVRRIQGRNPNGREIQGFKNQLGCLAAATIRMAVVKDNRAVQVNGQIVDAFDLWFFQDQGNRGLWPSTVHLSERYFASLQDHAVPLDLRALAALANSSMGLDIYSWLAQRLHRIPVGCPQFVSWAAIKDQFGSEFGLMNNFRRKFKKTMRQVLIQYQSARVGMNDRGLTLRNSLPPVPKKRIFVMDKPVD